MRGAPTGAQSVWASSATDGSCQREVRGVEVESFGVEVLAHPLEQLSGVGPVRVADRVEDILVAGDATAVLGGTARSPARQRG